MNIPDKYYYSIIKLMVAYAYMVDNNIDNDATLILNGDRMFILAMWHFFVCHEKVYIKKYGHYTPLTPHRMLRMNRLWSTLKPYYHSTYVIHKKYRTSVSVYPID